MPPESYELRGKYSKLDRPSDSPPSRASLDASFSSSEEDLSEFDPLNYDSGTLKRKKPKRPHGESPKANHASSAQTRRSALRRYLVPTRLCCYLLLLFVAAVVLLLSVGGIWAYRIAPRDGDSPSTYPSPPGGTDAAWEAAYAKAAALVRQMTLPEKVNITTGTGWTMGMCVGNTGPVARLGFPSLCLQDGPLGLRFADNATAWPAGITVGASWNKELMYLRGKSHGREARMKGINVILGPSMGPLGRSPYGGRNWEGFGADPVLQGVGAAQTIRGIQEEGVMATAKHWVGNEQEHFRQAFEWGTPNAISSNIGDRALHELYAWPFAEAVRAGVASVMCAYNQVNNSYACQNSKLLNGVLKDELGFQGFVQSDWLAQRSGVASALAGLDMSMPGDGLRWMDGKSLWGGELTRAVLNGSVPVERINDMATRIVAAWYQLGQDDREKWPLPPPEGDGGPNFSSWTNEEVGLLHPGSDDKTTGVVNKFVNVQGKGEEAHGKLARKIAAEGIVLVKNEDNTLPLSRNGWKNDTERPDNSKKYRIAIFGEDARVNQNGPNHCADKGCNVGTLTMGWGSGAVELPYLISPVDALQREFNSSSVELTISATQKITPSHEAELLHDQDLCLVFLNADSGEGFINADGIRGDRNDLYTAKGGDDLAIQVGTSCGGGTGRTIIVIHAVGPVILENYIDLPTVSAVLLAHLPGQESGNALSDVLFGDVDASGRLPYTIAKKPEDYGPAAKILYYPNGVVPQQNFSEGLYIDYRHFDKQDIGPRYPFGHGLSYTRFHLSSLVLQTKSLVRTPLPKPRPDADALPKPPGYDTTVPDPATALFPDGFRRLKKYIYPYLTSLSSIKKGSYPYPPGYTTVQDPAARSPAGAGPGGNPDLYATIATVRCQLTNLGVRPGAAVVQLYVSYPANYTNSDTGEAVDFPVRVLRGFEKVEVKPGGGDGVDKVSGKGGRERKSVEFKLTRKDLSYWDVGRQNWVLPEGEFEVAVGWSSRDLVLFGKI
ncbi:hypothetical protein W97_05501 [Coniosporium apollinis CBS 100218]|uniref:Probable beta-glucosidase E n=1 Tax=Coniosporium apollinis (strain CBS 100218) TaxID=1168221 RepID=R7YX71_CONA1|nr:uncharacterized protein W97_05501 [Coniosporium apollinis CBS 100218]EON66404.1 hypothetical protein W97_05501 [Coniosporium apollinis CBS 100218]